MLRKALLLVVAAALVTRAGGSAGQLRAPHPLPLDSALDSATVAILAAIERDGVPCDVEGALPVAFWASWRHRESQSLLRVDRGFGQYIARELEARIPCPTALRGGDRDMAMRELQLQAQPFYDSSHPRFRMAGREFARSLYLVAGDWWKSAPTTVTVTVQVYHLLKGERLPSAVGAGGITYSVRISSISAERVRRSLFPHVFLRVRESFDEEAQRDLGFRTRSSVVQAAVSNALLNRSERSCSVAVVHDSATADVVISGEVRFTSCPLTPLMRKIVGDGPSFGYITETHLRIAWPSGRSAIWISPQRPRCPAATGRQRRRSDPTAAYMQAREWLETGADPSVAHSAAEWALRMLCSNP